MRKFLFFVLAFVTTLVSLGQADPLVLNEIYPDPKLLQGRDEYIEIYNTSGDQVTLDCYVLVSYFNSGTSTGMYVYNFPSGATIKPYAHFVVGSNLPLDHQGGTYPSSGTVDNALNWNASATGGSLYKYLYTSSGWGQGTPSTTDDLMYIVNGAATSINVMLYKITPTGTVLANAFFANESGGIPTAITSLPPLPVLPDCGNSNPLLNFSPITFAQTEVYKIIQNTGSDNGYRRVRDGYCGQWEKAEQPGTYTPGASNSASSLSTSANVDVSASGSCQVNASSQTLWQGTITVKSNDLLPATYRMYSDNDGSLSITANDVLASNGQMINSDNNPSTNETVTFSNVAVNQNRALLIQVTTASGCIEMIRAFEQSCAPLPVTFRAFTAFRNKQVVALRWETVTEQNNRGFYIQRNTKGVWENLAFVFSAANGGNSNELLSYSYNDVNGAKGVSQYRIQQVDLDGKASFSPIRSVRGEEQSGRTIVYPNPATEGKVNVVFESQGARDVLVRDMNGRLVRHFKDAINSVVIDRLQSGVYSIQIIDLSTAESSVEKVIIK